MSQPPASAQDRPTPADPSATDVTDDAATAATAGPPATTPVGSPGPGSAPGRPAGAPPAGRPSRHGRGGWRSLVISMAILLGIVALWIALLPRPAGTARPAVDVGSSARYVAAETGTTLYVPSLPAPWRPTSVRTTDTASVPGWHAGYTHEGDDRAYVAVEETAATGADSDDAWTRAILKTATEREARTVGGRTWALYSDGGDPERRSLVGRIEGTLVVVTGLADLEVLEAAAGSLQSVEPTASSAPPSASATP